MTHFGAPKLGCFRPYGQTGEKKNKKLEVRLPQSDAGVSREYARKDKTRGVWREEVDK